MTAFLKTLEQVTEIKTKTPTTLKTPHGPVPPSLPRTTPGNPTLDQVSGHSLDILDSAAFSVPCTHCDSGRRLLLDFNSDRRPR